MRLMLKSQIPSGPATLQMVWTNPIQPDTRRGTAA